MFMPFNPTIVNKENIDAVYADAYGHNYFTSYPTTFLQPAYLDNFAVLCSALSLLKYLLVI